MDKIAKRSRGNRTEVTVTLTGIPIETHRRLGLYRGQLEVGMNKSVKIDEAYVHFLNEKAKEVEP